VNLAPVSKLSALLCAIATILITSSAFAGADPRSCLLLRERVIAVWPNLAHVPIICLYI
jgi:hypothetical protein